MAGKLALLLVFLWALLGPKGASVLPVQSPAFKKDTMPVQAPLLWKDVPPENFPSIARWDSALHNYRVLLLNESALTQEVQQWSGQKHLERRPHEQIVLPLPDHSWAAFWVVPTAVLTEDTTSAFDHYSIKTFSGSGIDDVYSGVAFEVTPRGFHAMITMSNKVVFIQPIGKEYPAHYICYYKHLIRQGKRVPFEAYGPVNPGKKSRPE